MHSKRQYNEVNKALGNKYEVVNSIFSYALYKDFKNGFDVEINIDGRINHIKEIQVFMWYDDDTKNPINIKTYYCDKLSEIDEIVDLFYEESKKLIEDKFDVRKDYMRLKEEGWEQQRKFFESKYMNKKK